MSAVARRLAALQLADRLGNVAEACRRSGITRTQFYRWRQRHAEDGPEGLHDRAPVAARHPRAVPDAVVARLKDLSLANPAAGCDRLGLLLRDAGIPLSGMAIQKHLHRMGIGTRAKRWLVLEERARSTRLGATPLEFVARCNPCFGERLWAPARPGRCISQDVIRIALPGVQGGHYLHTAVDTFSGMAFASLHDNKRPETAVALLYNAVLPCLAALGFVLEAVVTDGGGEFRGSASHPFALYLKLEGIDHLAPRRLGSDMDGFSERFHRDVRAEWLPTLTGISDVQTLRGSLGEWLATYNGQRPFVGYPNYGTAPMGEIHAWHARALKCNKGR